MAEWKGQSKGTITGYKIFIFLIKNIGIRTAYFLLIFVSFYYFIFNIKQTRAIISYFRKRQNQSFLKSLWNTYRNNYIFGQTLIDRVAISAGLANRYTYEFDGIAHIHDLAKDESAGILISAHVGNFELAQFFMDDFEKKIHLVTTDEERITIKSYLDKVRIKPKTEFILVKDDLSHIFEINKVIAEKGMICFTGDRFKGQTKTMVSNFLGAPAQFPAGSFMISSRLQIPVLFVYVMRERGRHYHLYARKADFKNRDAQGVLEAYTKSMEDILKKYPLQWFNYYDFWKS